MKKSKNDPHILIIGGGFGGLNVALYLRKAPVKVTLIDKRNFHLFQPPLYQVASGGLSPADIAYPLRALFKDRQNIQIMMDEVIDIDLVD
jgi:NADH dehydrogenase